MAIENDLATGRKRLRKPADSASTLQDVATRAGVSTASVSRYLANPETVKEPRRGRIVEAISTLGYIPHGAARALASRRTRTIGAIVPTLDNAIFARGIQAFQRRLQASGFTLFVASHDYSLEEEWKQAETLIARGVDGMMLIGSDHDSRLYERLARMNMPYVNSWTYDAATPYPCVGFENFDAATRQTEYMLDIGHTEFGLIAGITHDNDRARDRLDGALSALAAREIHPSPAMIQECPYDIAASRQTMRRLLSASPRPTAIICGNDVLAVGALLECQEAGVRVPEDVSIVGFDDLPLSRHIAPSLTTIHVPSTEMGDKSAEYLLATLDGETAPKRLRLEANLILRNSTRPPAA